MEIETFHRAVAVSDASQPSAARFLTRDVAASVGMDEEDSYRAGLVATELGTNLVKHARDGEILVRAVSGAPGGEIEIIAVDRGPGMDIALSMFDGHSTSGTSGTGLGAVRRLADEFDVYSQGGHGSVVFARVRAGRAPARNHKAISVGAVSVPKSGERVCGDGWAVRHEVAGLSALVLDGLGHGAPAAEAATAGVDAFARQRYNVPSEALHAVHDGVRHTRGAAGAILEVNRDKGTAIFSGVGNVSCVIVNHEAARQTVSSNGTLGHQARSFRDYTYPWNAETTFVMYSDGLTSHWSLDQYRGLGVRHPAVIAAVLYRDFSRRRDDVTVLVGRSA